MLCTFWTWCISVVLSVLLHQERQHNGCHKIGCIACPRAMLCTKLLLLINLDFPTFDVDEDSDQWTIYFAQDGRCGAVLERDNHALGDSSS